MIMTDTQKKITQVCDEVKKILIDKNKRYGDSALSPVRIFSKSDTAEQIKVRIDDKLSRITKGSGLIGTDEDVLMDLIGYLVLLRIYLDREKSNACSDEPWDGSDILSFPLEGGNQQVRDLMITPNSIKNDAGIISIQTSGDKFS